jgi:hypothetical protein
MYASHAGYAFIAALHAPRARVIKLSLLSCGVLLHRRDLVAWWGNPMLHSYTAQDLLQAAWCNTSSTVLPLVSIWLAGFPSYPSLQWVGDLLLVNCCFTMMRGLIKLEIATHSRGQLISLRAVSQRDVLQQTE